MNLITCGQVQVIVDAFYRKNGTGDYYYAFPRETVQAAIRMYGYKHEITLPEDLLDIYWLATGIAGGVILLILLGLFILWRQKVKRDYSQYDHNNLLYYTIVQNLILNGKLIPKLHILQEKQIPRNPKR